MRIPGAGQAPRRLRPNRPHEPPLRYAAHVHVAPKPTISVKAATLRMKRIAKWACTLAFGVTLAAFSACLCGQSVHCQFRSFAVGLIGGAISFGPISDASTRLFEVAAIPPEMRSMLWIAFGIAPQWQHGWVVIPLWIPLISSGIATAKLWGLGAARRLPGNCRCGYNLTGNANGRCPECGVSVERAG